MFITASNLKKSFFKIAFIFIVSFNFAFATNLYYSGVCFVGNASEFDVLFPYSKTIDDKTVIPSKKSETFVKKYSLNQIFTQLNF